MRRLLQPVPVVLLLLAIPLYSAVFPKNENKSFLYAIGPLDSRPLAVFDLAHTEKEGR